MSVSHYRSILFLVGLTWILWYLPNLFYSAPKDAAVVEAIFSDDHPTVKPPFSIFDHLEDDNDYSNINFSDHEKLHIYERLNSAEGLAKYLAAKYPGMKRFGIYM